MDLLFGHLRPQNGSISWGVNANDRFYLRQHITIPQEVTIGEFIEMLFRINRGGFDKKRFLSGLGNEWQKRMMVLMEKMRPR
jgi:hypothetical protein